MTASDLIDVHSTTAAFRVFCGHLANATSLPDTYRLLSVFSGIPTPPLEALRRANLSVTGEDGKRRLPLQSRHTLGELVDAGWIRWVSWTRPERKGDAPLPPGYVLTGLGEVQLSAYFNLYGPVWPKS